MCSVCGGETASTMDSGRLKGKTWGREAGLNVGMPMASTAAAPQSESAWTDFLGSVFFSNPWADLERVPRCKARVGLPIFHGKPHMHDDNVGISVPMPIYEWSKCKRLRYVFFFITR